jgi:hypothetical protein
MYKSNKAAIVFLSSTFIKLWRRQYDDEVEKMGVGHRRPGSIRNGTGRAALGGDAVERLRRMSWHQRR